MDREEIIWTDHAKMDDFKVNPLCWIYTIATFGLYFLYIYIDRRFVSYTLTNQRIIKDSGIFTRIRDEVELYRVKDAVFKATIFQRIVGTGNIKIISSDMTGDITIENLNDAFSKREQIRTISRELRTQNGVRSILHE